MAGTRPSPFTTGCDGQAKRGPRLPSTSTASTRRASASTARTMARWVA